MFPFFLAKRRVELVHYINLSTKEEILLQTEELNDEEFSQFAKSIYEEKYAMKKGNGLKETWPETVHRVVINVLGALGYEESDPEVKQLKKIITQRKFIPGGRYLYATGRSLHQTNNCFLKFAEDSREGWANLLRDAAMILQTGGGLGVEYSNIREYGSPISRTGGTASGPIALMQMVNEIGRGVMQGGSRRSALIALLDWDHPDVHNFIHAKDWHKDIRNLKEEDFNTPAHMDMTNISVNLDDNFFDEYGSDRANKVFDDAVRRMLKTGEPGFSINCGELSSEKARNPCSEVVSSDDDDVCNLGSINLARISDITELEEVIDLSTLFLLAGTVYSHLPYTEIAPVRAKNRRLGLGLMGVHEWLLQRGFKYGPNEELGNWLSLYADAWRPALDWAQKHNLSTPIATRAIAPTGTIAIIGETTTGIEPIFCVAYKRRFLSHGEKWLYQYVVDPTAHRLIKQGIHPEDIEDAYTLSYNAERRIEFQAWIQQFVDMGVSSTINLPYSIEDEVEIQQYKDILMKYLPKLRGITAYPNGARGGQPLVPAVYEEVVDKQGTTFEENLEAACSNGVCGA